MTQSPINGVGRQATKGADSADSQAKQKALKILGDKVTKKFKSLNGLVEEIKLAATEVLKSSGKSPSTKPAREAVKTFLDDEEQDYKIDDCVRWHLLLQAVRIDQSPDPDTVMAMKALGELIVEARPYLAFENPYEPNKPERFFDKQCSLRAQHSLVKDKSVIFHVAARCGNAAVIAAVVEHCRRLYDRHEPDTDQPQPHRRDIDSSETPSKLLSLVTEPDPEFSDSSALWSAATAAEGSVETVEALLKVGGLAATEMARSCFHSAVDKGLAPIARKFLDYGDPTGRGTDNLFATDKNIILAIEKIDKEVRVRGQSSSKAGYSRTLREQIVRDLVRAVKNPATFNAKVVQAIIQYAPVDMWPANGVSTDVEDSLVHLAVFYQKFDFVEKFVTDAKYTKSLSLECPLSGDGLLEGESEARKLHYPLWYNNHKWVQKKNDFEPWKPPKGYPKNTQSTLPADSVRIRIRNKVVEETINVVDNMGKLSDIFHNSVESIGDLCFDISRFNSATYRVSTFVDSLISASRSRDLLKYEHTLRYVDFPPLDLMAEEREVFKENTHFTRRHDEVFRILNWLWDDKGVERIIKLRIPDRLVHPHDDFVMAEKLEDFGVEILDWKVLDLSIASLKDSTKGRIRELHLYSSGNRAVINHWFGRDGIGKLTKLETLVISVIKETCTELRSDAVIRELRSHIAQLRKAKPPTFMVKKVEAVPWNPTPKLVDLGEIAKGVSSSLALWLQNLKREVEKQKKSPQYRATKVAILDNGILSISSNTHESAKATTPSSTGRRDEQPSADKSQGDQKRNTSNDRKNEGEYGEHHEDAAAAARSQDNGGLWARIQDGRSFSDDESRLSPWLFASDPHGTQMANLICAIDPFCVIYVARVAEDSSKITPKRVTNAIQWARGLDVDVISMSFAMAQTSPELEAELTEATKQGIVMTCSAHDEGFRIPVAYPAGHKSDTRSLMVLAACDEYGKALRDIEQHKYDYLICGQNVAAGVIPFLKSEDVITGSSVSTALAAGLSSLVLTCDRLAKPDRKYEGGTVKNSRWDTVKHHLDKMRSKDGIRFLLLEKFGNISEPHMQHVTAEELSTETASAWVRSPETVLREEFGMQDAGRPRAETRPVY